MGMIGKLLKGYLLSILIFVVLTAVAALLLKFTGVPESAGWICLIAAMSLSCLFLGAFTGNLSGKRGLLYGLLASVILVALLVFFVLLCFSVQFSPEVLSWKHAIPLVFGMLGGVGGANLK